MQLSNFGCVARGRRALMPIYLGKHTKSTFSTPLPHLESTRAPALLCQLLGEVHSVLRRYWVRNLAKELSKQTTAYLVQFSSSLFISAILFCKPCPIIGRCLADPSIPYCGMVLYVTIPQPPEMGLKGT